MSVLPPVPDRVISNGNNLTPPWEAWFRQLYNYLTASVAGGGAGIVTNTSNFNVSEVLSFGDGEDNDWPMPMPTVQQTRAAGASNYIQYNSAGEFAASIKFQLDDTTNTMTLCSGLSGATAYLVTTDGISGSGNNLYFKTGDGNNGSTGSGGNISFNSGSGQGYVTGNGGNITFLSGNSSGNANTSSGGTFTMQAGDSAALVSGDGGGFNLLSGNSLAPSGNGGGVNLRSGDAIVGGNGGVFYITSGVGAGGGVNGDIVVSAGGVTSATFSGATNGLTLASSISNFTLSVGASGTAGTAGLQIAATSAGNVALRVNTSATIGTQIATFTATNKPGTATTAPTKWLPINLDGTKYYIPCWT
jgi:hypothetical protein